MRLSVVFVLRREKTYFEVSYIVRLKRTCSAMAESFPFGILGQMWYFIVSIPDPRCLSYFNSVQVICKA